MIHQEVFPAKILRSKGFALTCRLGQGALILFHYLSKDEANPKSYMRLPKKEMVGLPGRIEQPSSDSHTSMLRMYPNTANS